MSQKKPMNMISIHISINLLCCSQVSKGIVNNESFLKEGMNKKGLNEF